MKKELMKFKDEIIKESPKIEQMFSQLESSCCKTLQKIANVIISNISKELQSKIKREIANNIRNKTTKYYINNDVKILDIPSIEDLNIIDLVYEVLRPSCWDCLIKHLTQAYIKLEEVVQGYGEEPNLQYKLCIGHLAEASEEIMAEDISLANDIRYLRIQLLEDKKNEDVWQFVLNQLKDLITNVKRDDYVSK